jgi:hypothetical protein
VAGRGRRRRAGPTARFELVPPSPARLAPWTTQVPFGRAEHCSCRDVRCTRSVRVAWAQIGIPEGVGPCQRVRPGRALVLVERGRDALRWSRCWLGCRFRTRVRRSDGRQARLSGIPSLTDGTHGAFRPRPDGLKQLVDRAAMGGGHADYERASGRVRAVHAALAGIGSRRRVSRSRRG